MKTLYCSAEGQESEAEYQNSSVYSTCAKTQHLVTVTTTNPNRKSVTAPSTVRAEPILTTHSSVGELCQSTTQAPPEFTHSQNPRAGEGRRSDHGGCGTQGPRRKGQRAWPCCPTRPGGQGRRRGRGHPDRGRGPGQRGAAAAWGLSQLQRPGNVHVSRFNPVNGDSLRPTTNVHDKALIPVLQDPERGRRKGGIAGHGGRRGERTQNPPSVGWGGPGKQGCRAAT